MILNFKLDIIAHSQSYKALKCPIPGPDSQKFLSQT